MIVIKIILLTSALFCDKLIAFYSKFWQILVRLYLMNRLLSHNQLPLVWKLLISSFKIFRNTGIITIYSLLTLLFKKWIYFLFDWHNLLKHNSINTKMYQDLFNYTLSISNIFSKSDYINSNETEWCHMRYFFWNQRETPGFWKKIIWKRKEQHNTILMKGYSYKSDMWFRNYSHSKVENWRRK